MANNPRRLWLCLALAGVMGCGARATTNVVSAPVVDTLAVKVSATRVSDGVALAAIAIVDTGMALGQAPQEVQDTLGCPVLRLIGYPVTSFELTQRCGPIPDPRATPMVWALRSLHTVHTCAAVRGIVGWMVEQVQPIYASVATVPTLLFRVLASNLNFAMALMVTGASTC